MAAISTLLSALALLCHPLIVQATGTYQEPEAFVREVFSGVVPSPRKLWIKPELAASIRDILGRDLGVLRIGYWGESGRSAWILEEIGKEQPITVGVVVNGDSIEILRVLVFREVRGWEVRYPFFTDQFRGATLDAAGKLDRHIDGISGATLSVGALTRIAHLALLLHRHSEFAKPLGDLRQ